MNFGHDKFCEYHGETMYDTRLCTCEYLARVRADERDSAIERIIEDVVPYGPEFDLARDNRTTAWLIMDEVINAIRRGTQP